MKHLLDLTIVAVVLSISILCFAGAMSMEQASASNIQSIYMDLHGGR